MSDAPLSHLTVVDFSRYRAGPWCSNLLGELGAEVIKVERPGTGDPERGSYPQQGGMGVSFIPRNRNKKSVAVDHASRDVHDSVVKFGTEFVRRLSDLLPGANYNIAVFAFGRNIWGAGFGYAKDH